MTTSSTNNRLYFVLTGLQKLVSSRNQRAVINRCIEETLNAHRGYFICLKEWLVVDGGELDIVGKAAAQGFRPSMVFRGWFYALSDDSVVHLKMIAPIHMITIKEDVFVWPSYIDKSIVPYILGDEIKNQSQPFTYLSAKLLFEAGVINAV